MDTAEIRRRFIAHFQERGHQVVPSASLLLDDPNLLFVNAGMVPFKPYFLGQETPPYKRAVSVQKCVRTLDIEEVGKTTRHGTFFQMNGNFSFGDYFKEGAIEHAWELVAGSRDEGGFGFDPDRVWVTVYEDDDESAELWRKIAGLPAGADPAPWSPGQLLAHGCARPRRSLQRDLHRPWPGVRPRRRARGRRGPLPRDLEPRVHAVRAERRAQQGRLRRPRRPSEQEHRHRHGPRACGLPAPGQAQPVRDRRGLPRHRARLRDVGPTLRCRPHRRRPLPRGRRPRAQRHDADLRRRHPRQRGAWLRPAAPASPRGPVDAAPRGGGPRPARADAGQPRQDEAVLPRARDRLGADLHHRLRRGGGVPRHLEGRHEHLRHGGLRRQERRRSPACRAARRSRCTTPTASPSTSPWRWPPSRASRSTRRASAAS